MRWIGAEIRVAAFDLAEGTRKALLVLGPVNPFMRLGCGMALWIVAEADTHRLPIDCGKAAGGHLPETVIGRRPSPLWTGRRGRLVMRLSA